MTGSTAWRRLGFWRLTRHPLAKRLHETLTAAGVYAAQLDRFVRDTSLDPGDAVRTDAVDEIRSRRASAGVPTDLDGDPVAPSDLIVTAVSQGEPVGYLVLSDRPVWVPALRRRLSLPGGYVWRVYVDPGERGQGIGTTLVSEAIRIAATTLDVVRINALVAPDNVPSRRAFARLGFTTAERYTTFGLGDQVWSRVHTDT